MGFAHHEKEHRICKSASHYVLSKRNAEIPIHKSPLPTWIYIGIDWMWKKWMDRISKAGQWRGQQQLGLYKLTCLRTVQQLVADGITWATEAICSDAIFMLVLTVY